MKYLMSIWLAVLGAASLALPANAQNRTFKAWNAQCTENACIGATLTPGGRISLGISHGSGANSRWRISLANIAADVAPGAPVAIGVDGQRPMLFRPGSGYRIEGNTIILGDPARLPQLLVTLRRGNRAILSFTHVRGFPLRLDFSLAGLSAAIAWMDERQGRTDAPKPPAQTSEAPQTIPPVPGGPDADAGAETGADAEAESADAPADPPETEKPSVADEPKAAARIPQAKPSSSKAPAYYPGAILTAHLDDGVCKDFEKEHLKDARIADQLEDNKTVYLLPCYAGAYNVIYRVYVFDKRYPSEVKRELFAGYSDDLGWYGKDSLINADYDPKTKTLSAFEKGRGLGDCGSSPTYQWSKHGWRLMELRSWDKCDGSRQREKWPVVFQHPDHK